MDRLVFFGDRLADEFVTDYEYIDVLLASSDGESALIFRGHIDEEVANFLLPLDSSIGDLVTH